MHCACSEVNSTETPVYFFFHEILFFMFFFNHQNPHYFFLSHELLFAKVHAIAQYNVFDTVIQYKYITTNQGK